MRYSIKAACRISARIMGGAMYSLIIVTPISDPDLGSAARSHWMNPAMVLPDGMGRFGVPTPGPAIRNIMMIAGAVRATISAVPDGPETMTIMGSGGPLKSPVFLRIRVLPVDWPAEVAKEFVNTINADARCQGAGISAELKNPNSWTFTIFGPDQVEWKADDGIQLTEGN